MSTHELKNIISQGEGYFIEFKRNLNSDLTKEIVAFANASGGNIYLGINDDGTVSGIQVSNQLISKIQKAANGCNPPVKIEIIPIENILQIRIPESDAKPHRTTSGFYLRSGANSQKMKTDSIIEFIEKEGRIRFDERIRNDIDFHHNFSDKQWRRFLKLSGISPDVDRMSVLQSLGAVKANNNNPRFTNVGILIFTDSPSNFLQQAFISCVAFRTNEKVDIIDKKDFCDDFFSNIENALHFIERHINVAAKIVSTIREDIWEVPKVALREAVVNAVTHRDYLETGARVVIEVYPGKIIISNPGGLPKGLPVKDFGKYSLARNALLANLMHRAGFIERLGTGITRIKQEVKKAGIPEVQFHYNYFFAVEFRRKKGSEKSSEKGSEKSSEKILKLISQKPHISANEISLNLGISQRAVEKNMANLKKQGKIKRIGPAKGGKWVIINESKKP